MSMLIGFLRRPQENFAGSVAAHPLKRDYIFHSDGKTIDLDAIMAGLSARA